MIMHDWNNEKENVILLIHPMLSLIILVRQSRQSGVARATCPG